MLKSMTAFGRASRSTDQGHFVAEIQSVNRKFLEILPALPKELARFDHEIRSWISSAISRGKVSVKIFASYSDNIPLKISPNLPLARQLKSAWEAIMSDLQTDDTFSARLLKGDPGLFLIENEMSDLEGYRTALKEVVEAAIREFVALQIAEGEALQADILSHLSKIKPWVEEIRALSPNATTKYREKLLSRIKELLTSPDELNDTLIREVALFAERIDISEELIRLDSHLVQFEKLLNNSTEPVGKTMEFLIQEMVRETNTIGSKSSDLTIAQRVVDIKSALEKIREQIQNIE